MKNEQAREVPGPSFGVGDGFESPEASSCDLVLEQVLVIVLAMLMTACLKLNPSYWLTSSKVRLMACLGEVVEANGKHGYSWC